MTITEITAPVTPPCAVTPLIAGYREAHRALLRGPWTAGELLSLPAPGRPAFAGPVVIDATAQRPDERVFVIPGAGFARYRDLDWIHRHARVEIGLHERARGLAGPVLQQVRWLGFDVLGLERLYGWVTPVAGAPGTLLSRAGFELEAEVPQAMWLDGQPASRQLWSVLRETAAAPDHPDPGPVPRTGLDGLAGPADPRLERLSPAVAVARLRTAGDGGRGFLGLDPVTQNDAALTAGLAARDALVWSRGDTLLGACPSPDNPRQAWIATTSADHQAVAALARTLRVYLRTASLVAATTGGEPAVAALRGCGFTVAGTLRRHYYRAGRYHDVHLHYRSLEQSCA